MAVKGERRLTDMKLEQGRFKSDTYVHDTSESDDDDDV